MEIVEEIRDRGPSSIAELAAALVRPQPSLYFHIHKLVKAGVVRVKEKRKAARLTEAVYALVPQRARREARDSVQRAERQAKTATALLRQAERNYGRVVREGRPAMPPLAATKRLRLTTAQARRLAADIEKLMARHSGKRDGVPYLWTVALAPVAPTRRR
jgi:predicted ArsR family transcriptional regulator